MITKTHLLSTFDKLPENLTIDQVIDHIIFVEKVQKGLEDSESGHVHTKEEAKKKLNKWLK
jgi:predicted transcriptional regulator